MAQDAVAGELGKGDLGDQLGLDPVRALRSARGTSSGALSVSSGLIRSISSRSLGVKAGADLARISQLALSRAARSSERKPRRLSLSYQPTMTNSWRWMHLILSQQRVRVPAIGRIGLFRDDALAALLADGVEQGLALADDMVAVEDRRRHAFEQRREPLLALDVGQLA